MFAKRDQLMTDIYHVLFLNTIDFKPANTDIFHPCIHGVMLLCSWHVIHTSLALYIDTEQVIQTRKITGLKMSVGLYICISFPLI